jgi:hypothetical protein
MRSVMNRGIGVCLPPFRKEREKGGAAARILRTVFFGNSFGFV